MRLELGEGPGKRLVMCLEKQRGLLPGDKFDFYPNSFPEGWESESRRHARLSKRRSPSSKAGCGRRWDTRAEASVCPQDSGHLACDTRESDLCHTQIVKVRDGPPSREG